MQRCYLCYLKRDAIEISSEFEVKVFEASGGGTCVYSLFVRVPVPYIAQIVNYKWE